MLDEKDKDELHKGLGLNITAFSSKREFISETRKD